MVPLPSSPRLAPQVRALPIEAANEEWAGVDAIFNEIIEEELMDAVRVRTLQEYGHILSTRRPHPNSANAAHAGFLL